MSPSRISHSDFKTAFGEALDKQLVGRGMKKRLAEALNVTPSYVSKIIHGGGVSSSQAANIAATVSNSPQEYQSLMFAAGAQTLGVTHCPHCGKKLDEPPEKHG